MSRLYAESLQGRVAVVTGGAGGIGAGICEVLARAGARIAIGYRESEAAARELAQRLPGGPHLAVHAPVTDSAALSACAREVEAAWGRCDLLVNCAGTTRFVPHADLDGLTDDLIDSILTTNVRGPFATVRAFKTLLERSSDALVVNVSSVAARIAMGSNVIYCASKAALDNMTRSLARALAPGIRVASVAPGLVETGFVAGLDPEWLDQQIAKTALGRLATPEEVGLAVLAAAVGMPCSTGMIVPVDGGRSLA